MKVAAFLLQSHFFAQQQCLFNRSKKEAEIEFIW